MKLTKAIEINQEHAKEHDLNVDQGYFRALNLGMEALKRELEQRNPDGWIGEIELPGETEE